MKNIEIDKIKKEVTLNINGQLYDHESILLASKQFSENFKVRMTEDKNHKIVLNLKPKEEFINDVNLNELGHEFFNYTLGLMQETNNILNDKKRHNP